MNRIVLSIVIPTLNEEGYIDNILEDILKQEGDYEVIVSDSGSIDRTEEIVREFMKKYSDKAVYFTKASEKGVSQARNNGAMEARGEYLLFLDADSRIPPDFLHKALEEMRNRNLAMAGFYLQPDSTRFIDKFVVMLCSSIIYIPFQYTKRPVTSGAGMIVKKLIHNQIKGFNPRCSYAEDLDYARRVSFVGIFRMIKSTKVVFSTRRFDEEGRGKVWWKYILVGSSYLLGFKRAEVDYEFGKFSKKI